MEPQIHNLASLFVQLGLDDQESSIEEFINHNTPVPKNIELHKAAFWNTAQATFLRQMKEEDADWAGIIDQLDVMLRQ